MKKFRIFKSDGKSELVPADRVEWKKTKDGLQVKFFIGKKSTVKFSNAVCLLEETEAIIPVPKQNETSDDD